MDAGQRNRSHGLGSALFHFGLLSNLSSKNRISTPILKHVWRYLHNLSRSGSSVHLFVQQRTSAQPLGKHQENGGIQIQLLGNRVLNSNDYLRVHVLS